MSAQTRKTWNISPQQAETLAAIVAATGLSETEHVHRALDDYFQKTLRELAEKRELLAIIKI